MTTTAETAPREVDVEAAPPATTSAIAAPPIENAPLFRLYFLRHAPAGDRTSYEGPDDQRPLTQKGRRKLKKGGRGLRELIGVPDAIVSSPYARAQETAELAAKSLRFDGKIELNDHLVKGGQPEMIEELLANHAGEKDLVLVGHSPDLEKWIAFVTTGNANAPFLELKKGGVCRVDITELTPQVRGILKWSLTPALVRELA